jgi:phosphate:Na+ symporter
MDFFSFLTLFGGLALFLYGMDTMGDGLKRLAGGRLEMILSKITSSKWKGFLLGLLVTAVIQSSSATTVMLVGFVNSGIMKLGQTISVVLGANIGTTVTAWLLSSSSISGDAFWIKIFKPSSFTPVLSVIGVVMMMSKSDKKKNIGAILLGFAILMFGMDTMSDSVSGIKDLPAFKSLLVFFENNPVMGILVGTILTAIIQSSSASVGILQAMALTGAIPYTTAIPVILGQNIGTTITPVISSITGNADSKRVALICVYTKIIGVVIVASAFYIINYVIGGFSFMSESVSPMSVAVIHTAFNIISTVVLFPFLKLIENLAVKSVRTKEVPKQAEALDILDERFLDMPAFAVEQCKEIVIQMAKITKKSILDSITLLDKYDENLIKEIKESESEIDRYEDKISTYLVKLSTKNLSSKASKEVSEFLHVVGDLERISDHSVNICEVAEEINSKGIEFSQKAQKDILVISEAIKEIVALAFSSLEEENLELAKKVEPLEQVIDRLKRKIKAGHIERLKEGNCTIELGFVFSDLLTNYERVSDHCSNIAVCLLEIANGSFDTHEYLSHVKVDGENDFVNLYEGYKEKFSLQ